MREVEVRPIPLDRLAELLTPERAARLREVAVLARGMLSDRIVWNVNATSQGGGVAEMLQSLLAYGRGVGVDTRWLALAGDAEFFAITKRLHNVLHGSPGDGGPLGARERAHYEKVLRANFEEISGSVSPGDIVLLHDPQTGGLVEDVRSLGARVVWRCHIGRDTPSEIADQGWAFLRDFIEPADGFIFSRAVYAPDWVPPDRLMVIPPSIDPFSTKNRRLEPADVDAVLRCVGLLDARYEHDALTFVRRDGTLGQVRRHADLVVAGSPPPVDARLVVQVSRWDRLKDMAGVMTGFADHVDTMPADVHLLLVGPDVAAVSDDPEGAGVLAECLAQWQTLPAATRARVHLVGVPMDDVDENAHIVNAVQHYAAVVVQKSIVEGFGLTVTEAMWKSRPVIASAVGGIQDQIVDGQHGLLLRDPRDLDAFAGALRRVLLDPELARRLGESAAARVQDQFLGDRHLIQYIDLFSRLLRE
jgi:trehalose synthase